MRFYYMKEFEIATEQAKKVIEKLKLEDSGFIKAEEIIAAVESIMEENNNTTDIECSYLSFSNAGINDNYGAMMCVYQNNEDDGNEKQNAMIIVNSDKDPKFQRFSLIHELGHLITGKYTAVDDKNRYTISAHIQYNITNISIEQCNADAILKNEQIANVFALKVLMPFKLFAEQIFRSDDLQSVANHFGVTKDAVRSRILLGE